MCGCSVPERHSGWVTMFTRQILNVFINLENDYLQVKQITSTIKFFSFFLSCLLRCWSSVCWPVSGCTAVIAKLGRWLGRCWPEIHTQFVASANSLTAAPSVSIATGLRKGSSRTEPPSFRTQLRSCCWAWRTLKHKGSTSFLNTLILFNHLHVLCNVCVCLVELLCFILRWGFQGPGMFECLNTHHVSASN